MKKLIRPDLLARLKNMKTASSMTNIPATAKEVLTILEALAQMDHNAPVQHLPQYVLVHAFRSLKLSTLEQREVIGAHGDRGIRLHQ